MASRGNRTEPRRPVPRLYLTTPPVGDPAALREELTAVLRAADVAAVLLRLAAADERTQINRAKALAPTVQDAGAALLLDGRPDIAAHAGADGAHLTGVAALDEALATLKPDRIAGCGGLHSRHDAMVAAEAGTDYVMFGEPDEHGERPSREAVIERVAWWAEVFEVPCVAYAGAIDEIATLVEAGADFIALGDWVFAHPDGATAAVAAAARLLAPVEASA